MEIDKTSLEYRRARCVAKSLLFGLNGATAPGSKPPPFPGFEAALDDLAQRIVCRNREGGRVSDAQLALEIMLTGGKDVVEDG